MAEATTPSVPRVRVVVLDYNGGAMVERCVEHLVATEWPPEALEIVVVDNASTDGSAERIARRFPEVTVLRNDENLGFSGGCNTAMRDLDAVDAVALVNSDAFVPPGWLRPLVEAVEAPGVGAANPKLLFAPRFVAVRLATETSDDRSDPPRQIGVRLLSVEAGGVAVEARSLYPSGWHGPEETPSGTVRWSEQAAELWVGLPDGVTLPTTLRMTVDADRPKKLEVESGSTSTSVEVGPEAVSLDVELDGRPFDVVNNAGNYLTPDAWGADRGFRQRDGDEWDRPSEVFAWCGGCVVLRRDYLDDVGLFDDRYFLYYEDFDLAWRGRLRDWRYRYVPESVVRHVHAASSVEGSPLFDHYVQRNRLLTLTKHAPGPVALRHVGRYLVETGRLTIREVVRPALRGRRPSPDFTRRRVRSLLGFLKHLPHAVRQRRRSQRRAHLSREQVMEAAVELR